MILNSVLYDIVNAHDILLNNFLYKCDPCYLTQYSLISLKPITSVYIIGGSKT